MTNTLKILIQIRLNLEYQIIEKRRSVLYILKKDIGFLNILKNSITSQETDLRKDLINKFDRKVAQYIVNFKEMKFSLNNDLNDKYFDEMEELVINVLLLPSTVLNNENSEAFFILLGFIEKAKEITINLADRSFSHFFIIIGNVLLNYIIHINTTCDMSDTYHFAYITINQYLFNKFYRIMIDTGISKHFTAGYG